jgi:hypothetical protein
VKYLSVFIAFNSDEIEVLHPDISSMSISCGNKSLHCLRAQVKMSLVTSGQYVGTIGVLRAAQLGPDWWRYMD